MSKPKKVTLKDGRVVWEVYLREGGRGSQEIRRRFSTSRQAQDFLGEVRAERKKGSKEPWKSGAFMRQPFKGRLRTG